MERTIWDDEAEGYDEDVEVSRRAPGKAFRKGMSLIEVMDLFPNEQAAIDWFESIIWPEGRCCGHCGAMNTRPTKSGKPMPYWCPDCRSYFSVRTGTVMARSRIPVRKWAIAIYLCVTSLKSVSSMKLHRDLGISQKAAWFMLHRLREAWSKESERFSRNAIVGSAEVDEAYFGGKEANKHASKRKGVKGGSVGKTAVVGVKDRAANAVVAEVIPRADKAHVQGFLNRAVHRESTVYTDSANLYSKLPHAKHEAVNHSTGEYVRGMAHTNGIESFWAMLKRSYTGTFHKISPKHLDRYVKEFAAKHNMRILDTEDQMMLVAAGMIGRRLKYDDLTADNGLPSGAR